MMSNEGAATTTMIPRAKHTPIRRRKLRVMEGNKHNSLVMDASSTSSMQNSPMVLEMK